jgi:transcriptional regulator with XRE-family HTH domain
VAERRTPSVRARQLAAQLRRLREVATLTGDDVAARLGWSPSKVSRIETSQSVITAGDLRKLLDVYEVSGSQRDQLLELGRNAQQRGWWDAYGDTLRPEVATLIALEADAESVRWWAPMAVPGLLQTEQYARDIIRSHLIMAPSARIDRRVQVRLTSQGVLSRNDPPEIAVVLDEAVVRRAIGGPDVHRAQLLHLAEMAERPNITMQVLPFAAGAHSALTGGFAILQFPEFLAADVVYLENMTSDLFVESEAEVYRYGLAFDHLCSMALGYEESIAFIAEAAGANKE